MPQLERTRLRVQRQRPVLVRQPRRAAHRLLPGARARGNAGVEPDPDERPPVVGRRWRRGRRRTVHTRRAPRLVGEQPRVHRRDARRRRDRRVQRLRRRRPRSQRHLAAGVRHAGRVGPPGRRRLRRRRAVARVHRIVLGRRVDRRRAVVGRRLRSRRPAGNAARPQPRRRRAGPARRRGPPPAGRRLRPRLTARRAPDDRSRRRAHRRPRWDGFRGRDQRRRFRRQRHDDRNGGRTRRADRGIPLIDNSRLSREQRHELHLQCRVHGRRPGR